DDQEVPSTSASTAQQSTPPPKVKSKPKPKEGRRRNEMVIFMEGYQDGYPVKDSANTRGLAAWDNKVKYRAVNMESHKLYRKASYNLIKFDYNEFSDSSDEDTVTGKAENKKKV
uniref:Uncharacterized protein n=1 Tax=Clytia hemisphaerica TaxID=252671 RepID=A0A7M5UNF5_9CNID